MGISHAIETETSPSQVGVYPHSASESGSSSVADLECTYTGTIAIAHNIYSRFCIYAENTRIRISFRRHLNGGLANPVLSNVFEV